MNDSAEQRAEGAPASGRLRILGVDFFTGTAREAVERMMRGGLMVVPAAPALVDLPVNAGYREALLEADLVLPDSAFMVLVWNAMERPRLRRLSGLEYLRELLRLHGQMIAERSLWIMASPRSAEQNLAWLAGQGICVPAEAAYVAPMYGVEIADEKLLQLIRERRPEQILVTVGGGTQERLGLYLKRSLDYSPGIHCIGAAIAFLSGDQVAIPKWADRYYLGWLLRSLSAPRRYVPRYWKARKLLGLMVRSRSEFPR